MTWDEARSNATLMMDEFRRNNRQVTDKLPTFLSIASTQYECPKCRESKWIKIHHPEKSPRITIRPIGDGRIITGCEAVMSVEMDCQPEHLLWQCPCGYSFQTQPYDYVAEAPCDPSK